MALFQMVKCVENLLNQDWCSVWYRMIPKGKCIMNGNKYDYNSAYSANSPCIFCMIYNLRRDFGRQKVRWWGYNLTQWNGTAVGNSKKLNVRGPGRNAEARVDMLQECPLTMINLGFQRFSIRTAWPGLKQQ